MAGTDNSLAAAASPAFVASPASGTADGDGRPDSPSLPLYLAGAVITLCGALAANSTLSTPDPGWLLDTLLLAGLGFLFSFGSRRLGINAKAVDFGFAALALLILTGIVTGQIAPEQFLPTGADIPQVRLLCALVWGATFWAWALRSDTRVMGCVVPSMAALGLSAENNLNDSVLVCFGVFILTVIFLLIHLNYLQNRARASAPERSLIPPRLLAAQFAQAGLCGLIVLLLGLVVIVPAQAVFSRLSLGQAIRRLAALGKTPPAAPGAVLRFSDDDNLQIGAGDAWSSSPEVVMRVTPSDHQEHLWRGRTYDLYTGDGWQSSLENQKQDAVPGNAGNTYRLPDDLTPGDSPIPGAPTLTAVFKVIGETGQFYYAAPPRFLAVENAEMRLPRVCKDGRLDLAQEGAVHFAYAVTSELAPDPMQAASQARLRQAGTNYPAEVKSLYLPIRQGGLTSASDLQFYQKMLAEALQPLPPEGRTPLDEALAIRAWVSRRCVYSLAVPPLPDGTDHVHAFLGDSKRGYCDMFASSMAVLCRTAGIPARLATGFAPGVSDGDGFNLRGADKHAWTEVYFPGSGWVAFDPTAGSQDDGSVPSAQSARRSGLVAWFARLHLPAAEDLAPILLLSGAIALILAYVVKTELFDRRRVKKTGAAAGPGRGAAGGRLGQQYGRLTRALGRLGLPRQVSETPAEYAVRAVRFVKAEVRERNLPLTADWILPFSAAFAHSLYGNSADLPPAPEPPAEWERELVRLEAAARFAWWRRMWRRTPSIAPLPEHQAV